MEKWRKFLGLAEEIKKVHNLYEGLQNKKYVCIKINRLQYLNIWCKVEGSINISEEMYKKIVNKILNT